MTNVHLSKIFESLENFSDSLGKLLFGKKPTLLEPVFEVALFAEFGDYVAISLREKSFVEFEYVGVVHLL